MSEQSLDPKEEMVAIGKVESHDSEIVLCLEGAREDTFYILLDGDDSTFRLFLSTEVECEEL